MGLRVIMHWVGAAAQPTLFQVVWDHASIKTQRLLLGSGANQSEPRGMAGTDWDAVPPEFSCPLPPLQSIGSTSVRRLLRQQPAPVELQAACGLGAACRRLWCGQGLTCGLP